RAAGSRGGFARRVRAAGSRGGISGARLRLILKPGGDAGLLSGVLAAYASRPDARRVHILFSGAIDRVDYLRDGRADVGLLYVPLDDLDGLAHETLHVEGRVAILSAGHRLAGRSEVRLADLAGESFPRWADADVDRVARATVADDGPEVADVAQLLHLIAAGRMVAVLPRPLVEPVPLGIVLVPVAEAPPGRLVIAWRSHDLRPLVRHFVEAAVASIRRP
ncbi:LysR family substrate-binding domain-containing protein, partial [Dactylosporangium salmoneum]|uniref:LysR family substrate-binding domain-containing protein n=1 Tax=Dactylosporangium salmoneum TaxID=53361 RepID=UPI0031D4297E